MRWIEQPRHDRHQPRRDTQTFDCHDGLRIYRQTTAPSHTRPIEPGPRLIGQIDRFTVKRIHLMMMRNVHSYVVAWFRGNAPVLLARPGLELWNGIPSFVVPALPFGAPAPPARWAGISGNSL